MLPILVRWLSLLCASAIFLLGCIDRQGVEPPRASLHFPIALALSGEAPEPLRLFVANSNFNLEFNTGTVHAYDLSVLEDALITECDTSLPDVSSADRCVVVPEELKSIPEDEEGFKVVRRAGLLTGEVRIASFADGATLSSSGSRLYVPIRSGTNLTHIDVGAGGTLACGGDPAEVHACTNEFTNVDRADFVDSSVEFAAAPVDVRVGDLADLGLVTPAGDYLFTIHANGEASFLVDAPALGPHPQLVAATDTTGIELFTSVIDETNKLAWAAGRTGALIPRFGLGVLDDLEDTILFNASFLEVEGGTTLSSVRDIKLDPRMGNERIYLAARTPESLVITEPDPNSFELNVLSIIPVGSGPSRMNVELFPVTADMGPPEDHAIAFVSCFGSRDIYIIDLDVPQLITIMPGISGPFEIKIDSARNFLYATDFRSSIVRVYDLSPLTDCLAGMIDIDALDCSPELLGLLGRPRVVGELQ